MASMACWASETVSQLEATVRVPALVFGLTGGGWTLLPLGSLVRTRCFGSVEEAWASLLFRSLWWAREWFLVHWLPWHGYGLVWL